MVSDLDNQAMLLKTITMMMIIMMMLIKMMMIMLDNQAAPGDNLSVHYTGRLDGPEGKIFDTSRLVYCYTRLSVRMMLR